MGLSVIKSETAVMCMIGVTLWNSMHKITFVYVIFCIKKQSFIIYQHFLCFDRDEWNFLASAELWKNIKFSCQGKPAGSHFRETKEISKMLKENKGNIK